MDFRRRAFQNVEKNCEPKTAYERTRDAFFLSYSSSIPSGLLATRTRKKTGNLKRKLRDEQEETWLTKPMPMRTTFKPHYPRWKTIDFCFREAVGIHELCLRAEAFRKHPDIVI